MATQKTKIEITEKDIKELVCIKYGIDIESATISVSHCNGDAREPSYTNIIVEGKPKNTLAD